MTHRSGGSVPQPSTAELDLEDQMILRVPEHLAVELRSMIQQADEGNVKNFDPRVAFAVDGA